ncbi:MocR-like pyridoxine biosynthesis transcription factor PdxR [Streptomyces jumonjinensis]|uniref:MocR-like pyridoxine biosynthesis transcription factor PdxR n=1 Tax=Streptomyces jumonjinensis TaxID=1945 RepID=UPI0037A2215C
MRDPWADSAGDTGADLYLELRGTRLRTGLMDALREAVRSGRLAPGARLPSSRTLAADLGLARNTVAAAYAELAAEGWLTARQGSGTRVAPRAEPRRAAVLARFRPDRRGPRHSLIAGRPDVASFPRAEWLKASRRALTDAPDEAFGYGGPHGRIELRTALADYLARARGVRADPGRIVICSGFVHALMLLGQVLRERRTRALAVEAYGLDLHLDVLTGHGLRTPALPFDELGTRLAPEVLSGAGAVLLTAAHQFPMGLPLHPDRRAAVVDWARTTGGMILEDDYDGEFRYDRQPVGALQGLDPDRVVYLGTASKSLAPGLRLGWMVLPQELVDEVLRAKALGGAVDWALSSLDQLTLAEFIASGAYDRHVRGMRQRYRRRRDQLVAALAERAPDVRVTGIAAGLHAVVELPPGAEGSVVQAASWQGLAVEGLSRFRHPDTPPGRDALVVGYAGPSDSAWAGALDALCRVLP